MPASWDLKQGKNSFVHLLVYQLRQKKKYIIKKLQIEVVHYCSDDN